MMKFVLCVVALLATLSLVSAEVIDIQTSNFDQIVKDPSKDVLVSFTATWCGHCQRMKGAYAELSEDEELKSAGVVIANVDVPANEELASANNIEGFPTIKLFTKANKDGIEHNGARSAAALKEFIKSNM